MGVRRTLQQVGIPRSTFYNWYDRYVSEGFDGLEDKKPDPGPVWKELGTWMTGTGGAKVSTLGRREFVAVGGMSALSGLILGGNLARVFAASAPESGTGESMLDNTLALMQAAQ